MASRYAKSPHFDFCFHPIHVLDADKDIVVPCGKCNGCLLHKANEWSMRLVDEIDVSPYSYFFTLTYDNNYIPTLVRDSLGIWSSNHEGNIRHTLDAKFRSKDVLRKDNIFVSDGYPLESVKNINDSSLMNGFVSYEPVPISNYHRDDVIPYASKRDLQLFLKLVRVCIDRDFKHLDYESKRFRYYIISEFGETKFRPHFHGIIFFNSREVSETFKECYIHTCWSMCSPLRHQYDHYCDSGAAGYITNYLTCNSLLPKVYQEVKELRPFRLASKSPAIGYSRFCKEEISEEVSRGNLEFTKDIRRLGAKYVFRFPTAFVSSFFPKCYRFNHMDFQGLLAVYGMVYFEIEYLRRLNFDFRPQAEVYLDAVARLREVVDSSRLYPAIKCYKICEEFGYPVFHYVHLLDMFYYKKDMYALRSFYEYQSRLADAGKFYDIACMYGNLWSVLSWSNAAIYTKMMACYYFLEGLHLYASDFDSYDKRDVIPCHVDSSAYILEVDDIMNDMVKLPKFNEFCGVAPQCFTD